MVENVMTEEEARRFIAVERSRIRSMKEYYDFCGGERNKEIAQESIKDSQRKIEYYKYLANIDDESEEDSLEV